MARRLMKGNFCARGRPISTMRLKTNCKAGLTILCSVLLLTAGPARPAERLPAARQATARATRVLLLPALDATPDAAHMLAARGAVIRHREEYEFITRQFTMLGEAMAARAAGESPRIRLDDVSGRTAGNLDLLARRTGADWVVSIVVLEAKADSSAGHSAFSVRTQVRLQVWDARRHGWLANGAFTGTDSGGDSPVFLFKDSLDAAVKGCLGDLLGGYGAVVTVVGERDLRDYLAGQTTPFVGDAQTPFSGLKARP